MIGVVVKIQYLVRYSEPAQYPYNKGIQSLVAPVPNDVNSD